VSEPPPTSSVRRESVAGARLTSGELLRSDALLTRRGRFSTVNPVKLIRLVSKTTNDTFNAEAHFAERPKIVKQQFQEDFFYAPRLLVFSARHALGSASSRAPHMQSRIDRS
jgi:hypothetical protein